MPILDDIIGQAGKIADIFNRSRCDYSVSSFMSHVQHFHSETMEEVGKPEQELHNVPHEETGRKRKYGNEGMVISPLLRRLGGFNGLAYDHITVVAKTSFYCFEPDPREHEEAPFVKRRRVIRTYDEF